MGPGRRRDTLDYHFGDYNWWKITDLGTILLYYLNPFTHFDPDNFLYTKMEVATSGVAERIVSHREFEDALKADGVPIHEWYTLITAWESDPTSVPNPFDLTIATPSQCAVRKALAEEESADLEAAKKFSLSDDLSPSQLISRGLDLEAEMYVFPNF